MTRLAKLLGIAWVAPATVGLLMACSDEGDPGAPAGEPDASNQADALPEAHADVVDAGMERCSASKLCLADLPLPRKASLSSIRGSSRSDVWAVGNQGLIVHYDGSRWEVADPVVPDGSLTYTARSIWLERADDVWIAEGDQIRHGTGWKGPTTNEWSFFRYPTISGYVSVLPTILHGTGNTVWVGHLRSGSSPIEKFEGWVDGGPGAPQGLDVYINEVRAVAATRPDEVWFAGFCNRYLSHGCAFRAILPSTGGDPDAGPPSWEVEQFDARTALPLTAAWAHDGTVWLVGEGGAIRRVTASTLSTKAFEFTASTVTTDLYGIFGFGSDDVWAVGEASTVLHWNGTSWSRLSTPFDASKDKPRLLSVWGSSPKDVWIAGDGALLHFEENAP